MFRGPVLLSVPCRSSTCGMSQLANVDLQERAVGYKKKDFKAAKFDFVDEMLAWGMGSAAPPARVLDVGCGFGGTSRHLAKRFTSADVQGENHTACIAALLAAAAHHNLVLLTVAQTWRAGITLSKEQVRRGTELAKEQGVSNVHFQVICCGFAHGVQGHPTHSAPSCLTHC
jgi:MPBQ/MSBQ methyltransferase